MTRSERGQVLPLVGLLMFALVGIIVLLGYVTNALVHASGAQTAADAAALAGAGAGREAALRAALANGATLLDFEVVGPDTLVTARVGDSEKSARARRVGGALKMSR